MHVLGYAWLKSNVLGVAKTDMNKATCKMCCIFMLPLETRD